MYCPDDLELQSYYDNEISLRKVWRIEKHIKNCPNCQQRIVEFADMISLLKKGLPSIAVPQVVPNYPISIFKKKLAYVAAVVVILGSIVGSRIYFVNRQPQWNTETEIMEQYVILHNEAIALASE